MRPEQELNIDPSMGQAPDGPPEELNLAEIPAEIPEEVEAPVAEEAPPETMLRVRLRTGKEYVAKTEREILEQLAMDHERLAADMETREAARTEVRGKVRYQEERQPISGDWDPQKYLDLLGKDPMEARRYQDRHYYGMDENEDPAEAFRFTYRQADKIADTLEVTEFHRAHPDIKMSNEDAALVLRTLDNEQLDFNARNLGTIYSELVSKGRIQPTRAAAAPAANVAYEDIQFGTPRVQEQPAPRVSRGQSGPRGTGGGARETSTTVRNYDGMTLEQLKAEAKKHGILQ